MNYIEVYDLVKTFREKGKTVRAVDDIGPLAGKVGLDYYCTNCESLIYELTLMVS